MKIKINFKNEKMLFCYLRRRRQCLFKVDLSKKCLKLIFFDAKKKESEKARNSSPEKSENLVKAYLFNKISTLLFSCVLKKRKVIKQI